MTPTRAHRPPTAGRDGGELRAGVAAGGLGGRPAGRFPVISPIRFRVPVASALSAVSRMRRFKSAATARQRRFPSRSATDLSLRAGRQTQDRRRAPFSSARPVRAGILLDPVKALPPRNPSLQAVLSRPGPAPANVSWIILDHSGPFKFRFVLGGARRVCARAVATTASAGREGRRGQLPAAPRAILIKIDALAKQEKAWMKLAAKRLGTAREPESGVTARRNRRPMRLGRGPRLLDGPGPEGVALLGRGTGVQCQCYGGPGVQCQWARRTEPVPGPGVQSHWARRTVPVGPALWCLHEIIRMRRNDALTALGSGDITACAP